MDRDLELWHKWNKTKSPMDLQMLINQLNPLIQTEVNVWAGTLARDTLEVQAKKLAVRAIKNFDPSRGVKLSTHVSNQIRKLSRVNYANQKAARMPEHAAMQFHTFNIALEDSRTRLGRDPTIPELADELRWSQKKTDQYHTQFFRKEHLESIESPGGTFAPHLHDPSIDYALHQMSPLQQNIYKMTVGYSGEKKLSNQQIMKKLGITQGVLSYQKKKIRDILELSQR